jgi:type I restriction enzyme S subunit
VREEWKKTRIGEVCSVIAGQSPKGIFCNDKGDGLPFYQGKKHFKEIFIDDPTTWTTQVTKEAFSGDILMSVRAPVGPINFSTQRICIGRGLAAIRVGENVDRMFLFYWLLNRQKDIKGTEGAVFASINKNQIENIEILLPPLAEQKRLVAILDDAFAGIEKAIANTEKNLANARELFESYLNSVFNKANKNWREKKLYEVCGITSKLIDPQKSEFIDLPHIGAGNIITMTGELVNIQTARNEGLKSGKYTFDEKMVLYSKIRPYLKKVTRPRFSGLCSADIYPLRPNPEDLDRDFLYYMLLSMDFTEYAIIGSARAGMPKVNRNHLFNYQALLPDIGEQKRLAELLNSLTSETKSLETIYQEKLTALSELKQSLLKKACSGELTAEDRNVEEAAA